MSAERRIVVAGGGIMGTCTAYYCSLHPSRPLVTLIEPDQIPAAASRNAGGLLAYDWHGPATESLGFLSYDLHASLAKEHDGATHWGYRPVNTVSVTLNTATKRSKPVPGVDWLDNSIVERSSLLGTTKTTAQVHPKLFVEHMAKLSKEKGVQIKKGCLSGASASKDGRIDSVQVAYADGSTDTLPCTDLVLACGPWTGRLAKQILPSSVADEISGVSGYRAHSVGSAALRSRASSKGWQIVLKSSKPLTAHALFTDLRSGREGHHPEIYCRPDGTAYICGASAHEDMPLPDAASQVQLHQAALDELKQHAATISPTHLGKESQVVAEQACYLPSSPSGAPLIGRVAGSNVFVNAGHTCWGISLGPGSGKVLSEVILDGKASSADIRHLTP